jgi:pimeloyl-ACP methyl ester carboxylesterase
VNLETHIADVLGVLECEDLRDVVLVGHSYGGMVATGVADRANGRVKKLVYLDAFAPRDGQSVMDLQDDASRTRMREAVKAQGEGWKIPPNPMPADTPAEDVAFATPRRFWQPVQCFEQKVKLTGAVDKLPRWYIYCKKARPGDVFRQFYERAQKEPGWSASEMDASHNPHITMPAELGERLDKITLEN